MFSITNTHVQIENVDITPWGSFTISNLYLSDNKNDTLTYVEKIHGKIAGIYPKKRWLKFSNLQIHKPYVKFISYSDSALNLFSVIDSFKNSDDSNHKEKNTSWKIYFRNAKIRNGTFVYLNKGVKPSSRGGMNYDDLRFYHVNASIPSIRLKNDTVSLLINNYSCKEKSGFIVKNISTKMAIANSFLKFYDTKIITEKSNIVADYLTFSYKQGQHEWRKFTSKVKIEYKIDNSLIDFGELTIFNEKFKGYKGNFNLSCLLNGTIKNLRCKNVNVDIFDQTSFRGNIYLNGLPKMAKTYFDARVNNLQTNFEDIEKIYLPEFTKEYLSIPKHLKSILNIKYQGSFKGFFSEFVCAGLFLTDVGRFRVNLKTTPDLNENSTKLTGNVGAKNFTLSTFLKKQDVKIIKGNIHLDGKFQKNNFSCKIRSKIDDLVYKKHKFQHIRLTADLSNNKIEAILASKDKKLNFNYEGILRFGQHFTSIDFTSNFNRVDLQALHIFDGINFLTKAKLHGKLKYSKENLLGKVTIRNLTYNSKYGNKYLKNIQFYSSEDNGKKQYKLIAPFADATIQGELNITKLPKLFREYYSQLIGLSPSYPYDFMYAIKLKDPTKISDIFSSDVKISKNASIIGTYSPNRFSTNIKISKLFYKNKSISDIVFLAEKNNITNYGKISIKSNNLWINKNLNFNNFSVNSIGKNNLFSNSISWKNAEKTEQIKVDVAISEKENSHFYYLSLPKQNFYYKNKKLYLNNSQISIDKQNITFTNTIIGNDTSQLIINGKISSNPTEVLTLQFTNSPLNLLSAILGLSSTNLKGFFEGNIKVSDLYKNRYALVNMNLKDIHINNENFGNANLSSYWDNNQNKIYFSSTVDNTLNLKGNFSPKSKEIEMDVKIKKVKLKSLSPYFKDYLYNPSGFFSGNLTMLGTLNSPLLNGKLNFQEASIGINQTQTEYVLNDELPIINNKIIFTNFAIKDKTSKLASLEGTISMNNWQNPLIDVELFTDNFSILNSDKNNIIYGNAKISGNVKVKGTPEDLDLQANITTQKHSKIGIDLGKTQEKSNDKLITFLNPNIQPKEEATEKVKNSVTPKYFNSKLTISNDTDIELNFTSQIGNTLKSNGNGTLNFSSDDNGNLLINGQYKVESGNYLFSLFNLVNRQFEIQKGSYIQWNGDPYAAILDIKSIYKLKTNIANLLENSSDGIKNKTTVLCVLHMTENIDNPTLDFNIQFPDVDIQKREALAAAFPTKEELNKQIISLLLFNRFYSPKFYNTDKNPNLRGDAIKVTANIFANNYLSQVISKFNESIDLGVNYQSADEIHNEEIGIALSTQLFNKRVSVNTNLNWETQNQANKNPNTEKFTGDVDIRFKLHNKGKILFKVFTREDDNLYYYENKKNTQGIRIAFQDEFDTFKELIHKYIKFLGKNKHN